jgi:hypothetical protein
MKPATIIAIAVVVLANAMELISAAHNRSRPAEAVVELTQNELGVSNTTGDNSGMSLTLLFRTDPQLQIAASGLPRPAFAAFELRQPEPDTTSLYAIDTAPTAAKLRARHPDRARVLIFRCTLQGAAIADVLGRSISVPAQFRAALNSPHYVVTLAVGANYAPYILSVRSLP